MKEYLNYRKNMGIYIAWILFHSWFFIVSSFAVLYDIGHLILVTYKIAAFQSYLSPLLKFQMSIEVGNNIHSF